MVKSGTITITKMNGAEDCVIITIRDQNSKHTATIPIERFGRVLMGLAEEPCNVKTSTGKFHGLAKADNP